LNLYWNLFNGPGSGERLNLHGHHKYGLGSREKLRLSKVQGDLLFKIFIGIGQVYGFGGELFNPVDQGFCAGEGHGGRFTHRGTRQVALGRFSDQRNRHFEDPGHFFFQTDA